MQLVQSTQKTYKNNKKIIKNCFKLYKVNKNHMKLIGNIRSKNIFERRKNERTFEKDQRDH